MPENVSTQIQLIARPKGWPTHEDFRTVTVAYDEPEPGEVRVRNEFVSVDPYMRGRMDGVRTYIDPINLGETVGGAAVGRVIVSASDDLPVGTVVSHRYGWMDLVQADASTFQPVPDVAGAPASAHLHVLGMTGVTAYVGLTEIAGLQPGDTVFVSGAAGAVGTAVGQIAKLLGAKRVVGSAGTPEKVALLTEKYGYDAAFNYKDGNLTEQLAEAAQGGIDVFFDNVGGDHLEAALNVFNDGGRAALCGAIASYNDATPTPGPNNLFNIVTRGLMLKGFTMPSYGHLRPEFNEKMAAWFADGKIAYDETIVDGIENVVDAFLDMMRGANIGKMLVRVG